MNNLNNFSDDSNQVNSNNNNVKEKITENKNKELKKNNHVLDEGHYKNQNKFEFNLAKKHKQIKTQLLDNVYGNEVVQSDETLLTTTIKEKDFPKNGLQKKKYKLVLRDKFDKNLIEQRFFKTNELDYSSHTDSKKEQFKQTEEKKINDNAEDIFNKITSYNIKENIKMEELYYFFMNELPNENTFMTNIHTKKELIKRQRKENIKENELLLNKFFDYSLEIFKNNQIYFFAKIKKSIPYMKINIFISHNYHYLLNDLVLNNFKKNNFEKKIESTFIKVGKIESNYLRNIFFLYNGDSKDNYKLVMKISYSINLLGIFGCRKMHVEKYNEQFGNNQKIEIVLDNELPKWDSEYKGYKLDFNLSGRVRQSSKKNFIMKVSEDNRENENENKMSDIKSKNIIRCGVIDDDSYALDFIFLSPFEAFGIAITSIINKIACE